MWACAMAAAWVTGVGLARDYLDACVGAGAFRAGSGIARVLDGVERLVGGERGGEAHASVVGFAIPPKVEPVELDVEERAADRFVAEKIVGAERKGAQPIVLGHAVREARLVVPV